MTLAMTRVHLWLLTDPELRTPFPAPAMRVHGPARMSVWEAWVA